MRTLVIDDDQDQRMVVRTLLEKAGIGPISEASDAAGGLALAEAEQPDLILLDVSMPGPSGLDVLPEICRRAPAARVVILSNFPRRRLGEEALRRGAVGYVEKRVPGNRLVHEILVAAAIAETALEVLAADLPPDTSSARAARDLVRGAFAEAGGDLVFRLELLVSEVVTNAVLHAGSAPRLEAHVADGNVRVAVYDDDPRLPEHREPDEDRPGGRGLHLLDSVASRWGAEPVDGGKVVWFELDR